MKQILHALRQCLPIFLTFLLATSVSYLYAANWTNPPVNPPNSNTAEPINIGATTQIKSGNFTGNVIGANGFCLPPAVSPNASSTGGCISMWPSASASSTGSSTNGNNGTNGLNGGFSHFQVFDSSDTFTIPAGYTTVMAEAWGGGGVGYSGTYNNGQGNSGPVSSCGGGGGYGKSIFTVTPGQVIPVVVAQGGDAGGSSSFLSLSSLGGSRGYVSGYSGVNGAGGTSNGQFSRTGGFGRVGGSPSPGSPGCGEGTSAQAGEVVVWW